MNKIKLAISFPKYFFIYLTETEMLKIIFQDIATYKRQASINWMTVFSTVLDIYEVWLHQFSKKFTDRALHLNPFTVINEFYILRMVYSRFIINLNIVASKLWKQFKTAFIINKSSSASCKRDEISLYNTVNFHQF